MEKIALFGIPLVVLALIGALAFAMNTGCSKNTCKAETTSYLPG